MWVLFLCAAGFKWPVAPASQSKWTAPEGWGERRDGHVSVLPPSWQSRRRRKTVSSSGSLWRRCMQTNGAYMQRVSMQGPCLVQRLCRARCVGVFWCCSAVKWIIVCRTEAPPRAITHEIPVRCSGGSCTCRGRLNSKHYSQAMLTNLPSSSVATQNRPLALATDLPPYPIYHIL